MRRGLDPDLIIRLPSGRHAAIAMNLAYRDIEKCKELLAGYDKYPEKRRYPVLAAYDQVLKCSHLFNLLDARGAISVTERVGIIKRVRDLAVGTAKIWAAQQQEAA